MILFVANCEFPSPGGMAQRIERVVDVLSETQDVHLLCRNVNNQKKRERYTTFGGKSIEITRFDLHYVNLDGVRNGLFMSEFIQEIKLFFRLCIELKRITSKYSSSDIYALCSPMMVPLTSYFVSLLTTASPYILAFDDLDPETLSISKGVDVNHPLVRLITLIESFLCQKYKKIVVASNLQAVRLVTRTGINENKIFPLLNSISLTRDFKRSRSFRGKNGLSADTFIVSYVGTLSNHTHIVEGVIFALNAIPRLVKDVRKFKLVIVGDGEAKPKLESYVKLNGLEDFVQFTGRISRSDSIDVLTSSNISIIPWLKSPMTETCLPTKLLEYMATGKPVVAPNYGEFSDVLVHEKTGMLFKPGDTEDFIRKITILADDRALCNEIGKNAYRVYMEKYSWPIQAKKFKCFIEK
jgi:glycosyltransferase involved in cell wall biosynthesis